MNVSSLFRTPPPDVAVDITSRHVAAVCLDRDRQGTYRVLSHAVEPLPEGAVTPRLNAANVVRVDDVSRAIDKVWSRLGQHPSRVALVIPDGAARVSFVRFATVPARPSDLEEMIRFQIRKATPFKVEDAQVTFMPGVATEDGQEFIVVQARRDIVAEYEAACAAAGAHAGIVGLSSFNVINATQHGESHPTGDDLIIHVRADGTTLAILRNGHMVFLRHRGAEGEGLLTELIHQTAMYYEDRLGGRGFARVALSGFLPGDEEAAMRLALEQRLGAAVEPIALAPSLRLADRIAPSRELLDSLTPAIGMALACQQP
jgi:Tfp pilus assembly PilM family ATPase